MRTAGKRIAAVLTCLFCLAGFLMMRTSAQEDVRFVEESKEISVLKGLGIIGEETQDFTGVDYITREQFSVYVGRMLGYAEEYGKTGETPTFVDIKPDNKAAVLLNRLASDGIINGDESGNFRPLSPVTGAEAVKIIVGVLGYQPLAELQGGYPAGYITTAVSIGLAKNISADEVLSPEKGAELLYHCLTTDIMTVGSISGTNAEMQVQKGRTLLKERMQLQQSNGIVTANRFTALERGKDYYDGKVEIDHVVYRVGSENIDHLLGYQVEYYTGTGEREDELVFAIPNNRNQTWMLNSEDILASEIDKTQYVYWTENAKNKRVKVSSVADFIYNGKAYPSYEVADMVPKNGYVTLIDNNTDGTCEVVFVTDYETILVDTKADTTIYNQYNKAEGAISTLKLEETDGSTAYQIWKNGTEMSVTDIKAGQLLNVSRSKDGTLIRIDICTETISGRIESHNRQEDEVVINGKTYRLAKSFLAEAAETGSKAVIPKLGEDAVFYLDMTGKIAAVGNAEATGKNYAWMKACALQDGIAPKAAFQMLLLNGEEREYLSKEKIRFNQVSKSPAEVVQLCGEPQLVIFELDSNDELTALETAEEVAINQHDENRFCKTTVDAGKYINTNNSFNSVIFAQGVKILMIPFDNDKERYRILANTNFSTGNNYHVEAYDVRNYIPSLIVYKERENDPISGDNGSPLFLVHEVITTVDEDGTPADTLTGMYNGGEASLLAAEPGLLNGLRLGDIIELELDGKGRIEQVKNKIIDMSNITYGDFGGFAAKPRQITGKVSDVYPSEKKLEVVNPDDNSTIAVDFTWTGSRIYVCDRTADRVYKGSLTDMLKGRTVFLNLVSERVYDAVIYVEE